MATMPADLFALLQAYAKRFPVPQGSPGAAHDDACRSWTYKLAQQAAWTFRERDYGTKRAGPGRPLSKDAIAQRFPGGLAGWDCLVGTGTGHPTLPKSPPTTQNLTGQLFEAVTPTNWLAAPEPEPEPPTTPPSTPEPSGPPMPPRPWISYEQTLADTTPIVETYRTKYGQNPAYLDLAHNLYRRLAEYDRWPTLADVLRDI